MHIKISIRQLLPLFWRSQHSTNFRSSFRTGSSGADHSPGGEVTNILRANVEQQSSNLERSENLIEASDESTAAELSTDMLIYQNFISEGEENSLMSEIDPYVRKMKYEYNHWDDAIHGYRETERRNWTKKNKVIIQRIRELAFPPSVGQLAYVHILDLHKDGYIKPHVDSIRFCGDTIAGISLLSDSVMGLIHEKDDSKQAKFLLNRRSLYIMKGVARYNYTHEIYGKAKSIFKGQEIPRDRRITVICRNEANKTS